MCSLMSARILDIGSTTSPGHAAGRGNTCPPEGPNRPAAAPVAGAPDSMKPSMSRLVTRPATPEPCSDAMLTPCSAAIFLTSGDDFVRTRSSNELPLPECEAAIAGAGVGCRGEAGPAVVSRWGAGGLPGVCAPAGWPACAGAVGPPPLATGAWDAAIAAPFSVSSRATTVCTATVSPSVTIISASTPAAGAGISASTLSVEISKMGSSRFTSSPTFFNHFESVPSAIDSPICGMMMSTRATATPLLSVRPAAIQPSQCEYRKCDRSEKRSDTSIHPPIARRKPLGRLTSPRTSDKLSDQHRNHTTTEKPGHRGDATNSNVASDNLTALELGRRSHQYAASLLRAVTMSDVCGST